MHVRVCRDCGEEYRPEIAVCADCGGPLVDHDPDADARRPEPRASASERVPSQNLSGHVAVFQTREPRDLRAAAESLEEAGLAFHVVETGVQNDERRSTLSLFVREEDAPSASRLLAPLHGLESGAYVGRLEAEGSRSSCPACEATVPAGAPECPECGLALSREEDPGEDR